METYFEKHLWKTTLCTTEQEVKTFLLRHGLRGKTIEKVHVIGMAENMEEWSYRRTMRTTLAEAGIPYEDLDKGTCPYVDMTRMPYKVKICEPVVFVFTDGSTFEAMFVRGEGMRLSTNQIPTTLTDGTNHPNFCAEQLFECLRGKAISGVERIERRKITRYGDLSYEGVDSDFTFRFEVEEGLLSRNGGFYFRQGYEGWFEFGVFRINEWEHAYIPFADWKAAARPVRQIPIVEGHDCSSYFWIFPVKRKEDTVEEPMDDVMEDPVERLVDECLKEQISIEEDDVSQCLYYFLEKYFDRDYPYGQIRDAYCEGGFEWNLEHNFYTYATMRQMLAEIEACADLMEQDYDAAELADVKKRFWKDTRATEVVDFYRRFVRRMYAMMEFAPEYDMISFMGP